MDFSLHSVPLEMPRDTDKVLRKNDPEPAEHSYSSVPAGEVRWDILGHLCESKYLCLGGWIEP